MEAKVIHLRQRRSLARGDGCHPFGKDLLFVRREVEFAGNAAPQADRSSSVSQRR